MEEINALGSKLLEQEHFAKRKCMNNAMTMLIINVLFNIKHTFLYLIIKIYKKILLSIKKTINNIKTIYFLFTLLEISYQNIWLSYY